MATDTIEPSELKGEGKWILAAGIGYADYSRIIPGNRGGTAMPPRKTYKSWTENDRWALNNSGKRFDSQADALAYLHENRDRMEAALNQRD